MKRMIVGCVSVCVLLGIALVVVAEPDVVTTVSWVQSTGYFPDGSFFMTVPWGYLEFDVVMTGKAVHFPVSGTGHNLTDGTGRSRSQSFTVDWFTGQLLDRHRSTGTLKVIQFGGDSGTLDGVFVINHEVFGTAEEVLSVYPWAVPQGDVAGKGWWLWIVEIQSYTPIAAP